MTVLDRIETAVVPGFAEVIVPIDFSPQGWRILPLARTVARAFGADVRPVHVDTASPWRDEEGDARLTLTTAPYGRRVVVDVVADRDPASGIAKFAARTGRPLITLTTHGHTGVGELAFGSVCESVLRATTASVLTVGPNFDVGGQSNVRRIVACVSGETDAHTIVPEAFGWARAFGVPLELVSVYPHGGTADLTPRQEVAALLEQLVDQLMPLYPRVSSQMITGSRPGHEIVRLAESRPGTLLAMATHARPPLTRAVVGSIVMHVARQTPTGLLLRRHHTSNR